MVCIIDDVEQKRIKEGIKDDIARDQYLKYERRIASGLERRLPPGYMGREDIRAWVRLSALEAVELFDPTRNIKFFTFLYTHLRLRAYHLYGTTKLKKTMPQSGRIYQFSQKPDKYDRVDYDPVYEDHRGERKIQMREFVFALSPRSRDIFFMLHGFIDQRLYEVMKRKHPYKILNETFGLSRERVTHFLREVKEKAPKYLDDEIVGACA